MDNYTRQRYDTYLAQQAKLNGVPNATSKFNVSPVIEQKIIKRLAESAALLKAINVLPVTNQSGQTIGLGSVPHASRTNTRTGSRRQPFDVAGLAELNSYLCHQVDFDTAIYYEQLDAWAAQSNFQELVRDTIVDSQALAMIMMGFNGTHVATDTDPVAYPLLQDVAVGWLQKYRERAPQNVMSEVVANSSQITIGGSGDYKNLDAIVYDAVNNLINPLHRDDTRMVAIVGRNLATARHFPLVNDTEQPTEILAVNTLLGTDKIGGVKAITLPYVPPNAIFVTPLQNLSIYIQKGSRRRYVKDEPEYNRIANYDSANLDYVVEDYEAGALIENLVFLD